MKVADAKSPRVPFTVTVYVLPDATLATTKNVPLNTVPPDPMAHAEELKSPPGLALIVHVGVVIVSPLLN